MTPVEFEEHDDRGYVVVTIVQGALQEGQVCSFLEAHGIPAEARSDTFRRMHGIDGSGEVEILVPSGLAVQALELLAKAERGELEIDADS
jgi:hypothetical protein